MTDLLKEKEVELLIDDKTAMDLARKVDYCIADKLIESIKKNISFDGLEAKYGQLPISRRNFYRRKKRLIEMIEEEAKKK